MNAHERARAATKHARLLQDEAIDDDVAMNSSWASRIWRDAADAWDIAADAWEAAGNDAYAESSRYQAGYILDGLARTRAPREDYERQVRRRAGKHRNRYV